MFSAQCVVGVHVSQRDYCCVAMTRAEPLTYEQAVTELCADTWAPQGVHVATRHSDETLRAILPVTRTEEGRAKLGATPKALDNLVCVLKDPHVFYEPLGELTIRILRNLCVRSVPNQGRTAQLGAHDLVLDCIEERFRFWDTEGMGHDSVLIKRIGQSSDEGRLKMKFFAYAVEFLVNFVTCNADNAELVWRKAFPTTLEKLLRCANTDAATAAAALVHNCIAIVPERMNDIVSIWTSNDGNGTSLAKALIEQMKQTAQREDDTQQDTFSWAFMVIRRLIGASLLRNSFEALGPSLHDIVRGAKFSEQQKTFLQIFDAASGKSAESDQDDDIGGIVVPENTFDFLMELFEAALLRKDGAMIGIVGSSIASVCVISPDSGKLNELRMRAIKVCVHVLSAMAGMESASTKDGMNNTENDMKEMSGLRSVMMRCVAICCDEFREAQDAVRNLKGLPLVLGALGYEKDEGKNLFLREWAILAIRGLTKDNMENSEEIASYKLKGVKQDGELLEKAGLEAYMDKEEGRPRLRSVNKKE